MTAVPAKKDTILEVSDLTKLFPAQRTVFGRPVSFVRAVDHVSFSLEKGEILGIVGESGCGKSTLGRLVLRLLDPSEGSVRFRGREIADLREGGLRPLRRNMQIIFQDPFASLNPRMTVGQILAEPLALHHIVPASERAARVAELLGLVGLSPAYAARYPHEFSGGQRQRIGIARALAAEPDLIVADEVVSALDVSVQAQVLNLLKELQQRLSLTVIFIAHNLAVVRHVVSRVAVMYLGRIVEIGETEAVFTEPRHPYTRALLSAIPVPHPGMKNRRIILSGDVPSPINPPSGCPFHTRCPHAVAACGETLPDLLGSAAHRVACHRWREIGPAQPLPQEGEGEGAARLARLQSHFATSRASGA